MPNHIINIAVGADPRVCPAPRVLPENGQTNIGAITGDCPYIGITRCD